MAKLIGILGGTFDPVHYGHLRSAQDVMQNVGLDHVRFVPNKTPPHRQQPVMSGEQRRQMLEMALQDSPRFVLDDLELKRQGASYMVDSMTELKRQFKDDHLCLIMGMDAFAGFTDWHKWASILELGHLIVTTRPGSPAFEMQQATFAEHYAGLKKRLVSQVKALSSKPQGQILLQSVTSLDISASQIRASLNCGNSVQYLLPENVREFLTHHYAN